MTIIVGSTFTGIAGLDLAFEWAGCEIGFQVEINDDCNKVLEEQWPNVPRFKDAKTFGRKDFAGAIDIIAGGPPCQPYSRAGKRRGTADDRHLWPEMFRIIREFNPRAVLFENVDGIIDMVLPDIISDLEGAGYTVVPPALVPACAVGATHRRYRVFLVAYAQSQRTTQQPGLANSETLGGARALPGNRTGDGNFAQGIPVEGRVAAGSSSNVADAEHGGRERRDAPFAWASAAMSPGQTLSDPERQFLALRQSIDEDPDQEQQAAPGSGNGAALSDLNQHPAQRLAIARQERLSRTAQPGVVRDVHGLSGWLDSGHRWPAFIGQGQHEWEPPRTVKGFTGRDKRIKALGNAVVPQVAYPFAKAIVETLQREDLG